MGFRTAMLMYVLEAHQLLNSTLSKINSASNLFCVCKSCTSGQFNALMLILSTAKASLMWNQVSQRWCKQPDMYTLVTCRYLHQDVPPPSKTISFNHEHVLRAGCFVQSRNVYKMDVVQDKRSWEKFTKV